MRAQPVRSVCLGLVWVSVAAAIAGFLLPWASLDVKSLNLSNRVTQLFGNTPLDGVTGKVTQKVSRVVVKVKRGTQTVAGELPDLSTIPTQVNGPQIPQLANRQDAQVVFALTEMLTGQSQIGVKSYAVYLLPGLALLFGMLLTLTGRLRLVCLLIGLICVGVAAGGFWKLLTTNTNALLVKITIGQGLWMSLWAYVGLGIASFGLAVFGGAPAES